MNQELLLLLLLVQYSIGTIHVYYTYIFYIEVLGVFHHFMINNRYIRTNHRVPEVTYERCKFSKSF